MKRRLKAAVMFLFGIYASIWLYVAPQYFDALFYSKEIRHIAAWSGLILYLGAVLLQICDRQF